MLAVTFVWPGLTYESMFELPYDVACSYILNVKYWLSVKTGREIKE